MCRNGRNRSCQVKLGGSLSVFDTAGMPGRWSDGPMDRWGRGLARLIHVDSPNADHGEYDDQVTMVFISMCLPSGNLT